MYICSILKHIENTKQSNSGEIKQDNCRAKVPGLMWGWDLVKMECRNNSEGGDEAFEVICMIYFLWSWENEERRAEWSTDNLNGILVGYRCLLVTEDTRFPKLANRYIPTGISIVGWTIRGGRGRHSWRREKPGWLINCFPASADENTAFEIPNCQNVIFILLTGITANYFAGSEIFRSRPDRPWGPPGLL